MGYLEAPLNPNPSDRETKTTMVTRVMLRVSSNQKDEVDAAFRYRIYRMAGVLSRKDSRPLFSSRTGEMMILPLSIKEGKARLAVSSPSRNEMV